MTDEIDLNALYETPVYKAVEAAGGVSPLARLLGVSRQVVYTWLRRGWVPTKRAFEIESRLNIPRGDLVHPTLRNLGGPLDPASPATAIHYTPRLPHQ